MLELGEPMHAFDARKLTADKDQSIKIIVRAAEKGEILTLLDGNKVELSAEDLVIADSEKPLALAGVMGGEYSGVTEQTTTIVFEAANFNAAAIRKSSIRHGQRTDSSARFEKSLDPTWCEMAIKRAAGLTLEFCPGAKVASRFVDKKDYILKTGPVIIDKNIFEQKLGVAIPGKEAHKILEKLGFEVSDKKDKISVTIPTWRATKDVSIAEDLVEEVARIYGYDKIASSLPSFTITPPKIDKIKKLEMKMRDLLTRDLSFDEVYNYSFVSREQVNKLRDSRVYLELDNPLSKEKPLLRMSLLPNLIENAVKNIEYFSRVAIYEIGKVFWGDAAGLRADLKGGDLLPRQDTWVAAVFTEKKNDNPVYEVRRAVELIAKEFNLNIAVVNNSNLQPWQHSTRSGEMQVNGNSLGFVYELDPLVAEDFGLGSRLSVLEINLALLEEAIRSANPFKYRRLSAYPEAERDLAFVVDRDTEHAAITEALMKSDAMIKEVELFDIFDSSKLGKNKKSMAYRLIFSNPERTLKSEEVEAAMKKAREILKKKFTAEVRE